MPRKRRRTAWTAASEVFPCTYVAADTEMNLLPSGDFRIARPEKPARQLHFPREEIGDFPRNPASQHLHTPVKQTSHIPTDPDDIAVLSFGSDPTSPAKHSPHPAASDPIDDTPAHPPPPPQGTPSQHALSAAPIPTLPTIFVARSLLPAMDQAFPTPDNGVMRSASKPMLPHNDDKMCTPLMVTTSEIRRAQHTLGLSPDTPGNSGLRIIDPDLERELRAVQSSTRRMMLDADEPSLASGPSQRETPLKGTHGEKVANIDAEKVKRKPMGRNICSEQAAVFPQTRVTPIRARRRLSDMSTVTPIPLNLESPTASKDGKPTVGPAPSMKHGEAPMSESEASFANQRGDPRGIPLFTSGKGALFQNIPAQKNLASPITPHRQHQRESTKLANGRKTATRIGSHRHTANNLTLLKTSDSTGSGPPAFVSGSGKKLEIPPLTKSDSGSLQSNANAGFPLFTTGSGKKVDIPPFLFTTGSGKKMEAPALTNSGPIFVSKTPGVAAPLFSTGSGKKVDIPLMPKHGPGAVQKGFNISSLLCTGRGNAVALRKQTSVATLSTRPPPSPQTPLTKYGELSTLLFRETFKGPRVLHSVEKANRGLAVTRKCGVSGNRRSLGQAKARTGLRSTPFKRPRQLLRPENSSGNSAMVKKIACGPIPMISVPQLLKSGRVACQMLHHGCNNRVAGSSCSPPDFLLKVGCLRSCLGFSFTKDSLGDLACLSSQILKAFDFGSVSEFGVQDCIKWMNTLFPTMAAKPASCIGSVAWTKLSYSLAVWKLGRLDLAQNDITGTEGCRFLCAANVIREVLRRLSFEWHCNRQPHLLRIMRRDSAPASHVVLVIADIEENEEKRLLLTFSDGWYIARASIDAILERRVLTGKLRIGEKVHVAGAVLQSVSMTRDLFCGDGDELCSSMLRISANNVRKRLNKPREQLGIQRSPLVTGSLRWVKDDSGQCPTLRVVVLRSYPMFYMETLTTKEQSGTDNQDKVPEYVFRREDAELEARAAFAENLQQKIMAAAEEKAGRLFEDDEMSEIPKRDVRCVKEVLVCGTNDDPRDHAVRKTVRIYNPPEDVQTFLAEGLILFMTQLWPKQNRWTGKPDGIFPLGKKVISEAVSLFPRKVCSILDLQSGELSKGMEFDGVFIVLHISNRTDDGDRRFVYFADDVASEIRVLALEISGADADCLPKVLRAKTGRGPKFPCAVLRDIEFQAVSPKHDLVHAKASLRSSFASPKALFRNEFSDHLSRSCMKVEAQVRGKETQLEILKEAVVSFASGTRGSIGAYFTSTQDM